MNFTKFYNVRNKYGLKTGNLAGYNKKSNVCIHKSPYWQGPLLTLKIVILVWVNNRMIALRQQTQIYYIIKENIAVIIDSVGVGRTCEADCLTTA